MKKEMNVIECENIDEFFKLVMTAKRNDWIILKRQEVQRIK